MEWRDWSRKDEVGELAGLGSKQDIYMVWEARKWIDPFVIYDLVE